MQDRQLSRLTQEDSVGKRRQVTQDEMFHFTCRMLRRGGGVSFWLFLFLAWSDLASTVESLSILDGIIDGNTLFRSS
jgi:hypothetical protein